MAKLSVVIVNYNVAYFLEQCLHSVYEAAKGIPVEIFVVDCKVTPKTVAADKPVPLVL